jgi:hypothetical protein
MSNIFGSVAQQVRAGRLYRQGWGFKSLLNYRKKNITKSLSEQNKKRRFVRQKKTKGL